ncbi:MAG: hypothetical protein GXO22_01410 [Aquificae bacterium]|nr:hypothetical protein [Aquificota bacterium]
MRYLKYFCVILLIAFFIGCSGGGSSADNKENQPPQLSVEDIKKLKANPKNENIKLLKDVISTSKDPKLKEQAVLALTDISIKNDSVSDTVEYLEGIAKKDKEILSVINAALDLLRENLPPPLKIDIAIGSPLKTGSKVDINFSFTTTKSSQVYLLLKSKLSLPDKSFSKDIETDYPSTFIDLTNSKSTTVNFPIKVKKEGIYGLKFVIIQKVGRLESYKYEKYILLNVKENTGLYKIY